MDRHRSDFASFHPASPSSKNHCQSPTFSILSSTTGTYHGTKLKKKIYQRKPSNLCNCPPCRSCGSTPPVCAIFGIYATECRSPDLSASAVEIPPNLRRQIQSDLRCW
ncbi:hypothetical protein Adt_27881 [Abeliophyllum distichum]|uniref:Uncharacterized protein n=1 Tax=Abeliophyllum distichum TaxID=126358 RepID=A0ABD1RVB4_9LAMI